MKIEQPGVTAFTELSDVPHSYLGEAEKHLAVNTLETGIDFVPGGGGGGASWGSITGTLSSQTDLQTALNAKQDTLVSSTNIKTINGSSVLGSGNLIVTGGASITETEVDFGTKPTTDATFTVTDAAITPTSKIIVTESGNPATGRADGDSLWDSISYAAQAATGQFTLYARASGAVAGPRKLYYTYA